MPLTLQLFGAITLHRETVPLPRPRIRKDHWLLALLALRSDRDTERNFLAGTFWPDIDESQALFYLRRSLNELRRMLGPDALRLTSPTPRTLRLNTDGMEVDVLTFDAALQRADVASLEIAVTLYRGDLLEGCDELWVGPEREARREAYIRALHRLAMENAASDPAAALDYLRRAVAVDFLNETAQRMMLEVLASLGEFAAVQQAYREFRLRLREEIQSDPAPETTALYQQIRARARTAAANAPRSAGRGRTDALSALPHAVAATPQTNLPEPVTSFIGREKEILDAISLLGKSRLLTLTGAGGAGKTRLALQVANEVLEDYVDGVWLVELASVSDPNLVVQSVATAVGVREAAGTPLLKMLTDFLKTRRLLLVLDNCEHLIAACAELTATLLRSCPNLKILASSRETLGTEGEQRLAVPPLSLPDLQSNLSWELLQQYEAVRLFVERASLVRPDFAVTAANASAVVAVCRQLDGLPLALELAAAQVRGLNVEAISTRLEDRFRLLRGGNRTAPIRQQTLRGLMDWSYDMLSEAEKVLLARLSVFAGGWTLEAAEMVAAGRLAPITPRQLAAADVVDLLLSLVDKSLVQVEEQGDGTRYRLLETVRAYALERLAAADECEAVRELHRRWCADFIEGAKPHLQGQDQALWLDRVEAEHDNLRLALTGSCDHTVWRIAGVLWRFWFMRGYWSEGRERLMTLLNAAGSDLQPPQQRADVLHGAGMLTKYQGDYRASRALLEEALRIRRELGHQAGVASTLICLGNIAEDQCDYVAARSLYMECQAISREIGNRYGLAASLNDLGNIASAQSDFDAAGEFYDEAIGICRQIGDQRLLANLLNNLGTLIERKGDISAAYPLYQECLTIYREIGNRYGLATALNNLGNIVRTQGDMVTASALYQESLAICREIGNRLGIADALISLGGVATSRGDYAAARSLYEESLTICREIGDTQGIACCLEGLADVCMRVGKPETAVRLWGVVEALREGLDTSMGPNQLDTQDSQVNEARATLGPEAFALAWQEGRAMGREQTVNDLLASPLA